MSSSVRLSVVCKFVRPTQRIEIFDNVSTPYAESSQMAKVTRYHLVTLAICELSVKILRRSSQGNPPLGVKPNGGSQI